MTPVAASGSVDAIVVGAGLSGLVAACEIADSGRTVALLEREGQQDLGGQAWWSFGGLFLVDTPEQRRLGVKDSLELARRDWMATADFAEDGSDDRPHAWAEAYLQFSAGEARSWLRSMGHRIFPVVGWAERLTAQGRGNSVPRFHITWGTGPGILEPFLHRMQQHRAQGRIRLHLRHAVTGLIIKDGAVCGVHGDVLAADRTPRGVASSREVVGGFSLRAAALVLTSGGIGGNEQAVADRWPADMGTMPRDLLHGVPETVDGAGLLMAADAGARWIGEDRMWHYTEGVANGDPVWRKHGIRILPGPSSLWLDARGRRLPAPAYPGFDTTSTLRHLRTDGATPGHDHSWFVLTPRIIEKEFALSGSEQNPDLTGRSWRTVAQRVKPGPPGPVQAFLDRGEDFLRADTVTDLVAQMNHLVGEDLLDAADVEATIRRRDAGLGDPSAEDPQVGMIREARRFLGDRLIRTAAPHRLLDPGAGGLIAVRLRTLLRKTLGGLETDLEGRVQREEGGTFPGLYAAGEVSGFGGGGYHGRSALEGTFLGGCLFSGRQAGRGVARDLG